MQLESTTPQVSRACKCQLQHMGQSLHLSPTPLQDLVCCANTEQCSKESSSSEVPCSMKLLQAVNEVDEFIAPRQACEARVRKSMEDMGLPEVAIAAIAQGLSETRGIHLGKDSFFVDKEGFGVLYQVRLMVMDDRDDDSLCHAGLMVTYAKFKVEENEMPVEQPVYEGQPPGLSESHAQRCVAVIEHKGVTLTPEVLGELKACLERETVRKAEARIYGRVRVLF